MERRAPALREPTAGLIRGNFKQEAAEITENRIPLPPALPPELGYRRSHGKLRRVLRIEPSDAIGTNAVRELGVRPVMNVNFDLLPISLVVANLFARRTNREQSAQRFHAREGVGQFLDQLHPFKLLLTNLRH